jgi:hypothetical protein
MRLHFRYHTYLYTKNGGTFYGKCKYCQDRLVNGNDENDKLTSDEDENKKKCMSALIVNKNEREQK